MCIRFFELDYNWSKTSWKFGFVIFKLVVGSSKVDMNGESFFLNLQGRISTNWPTVMLMKKMSINLITEQWNHSRIIQKSYQNYSELFYYVFLIELEIIKIHTYVLERCYYNWCLVKFLSGTMKLVCGAHILFYLN